MNDGIPSFSAEQHLAGTALQIAAQETCSRLDSFSGWMVAGFGGGIALILTNYDSVNTFIHLQNLSTAVHLFVWAAVVAFVAKYIASSVLAGLAVTFAVEKESKIFAVDNPEFTDGFSLDTLAKHIEKGYWYPWRWFARLGMRKILEGDLLFGARLCMKGSQFHGVLVLIQASLHLISLVVIMQDFSE